MTAQGDSPARDPRDPPDPDKSPDLTEPVMRRLGLPGLSPRDASRRRRNRALLRVAMCLAVTGAVGVVIVKTTTRPAPPSEPTISSAIRHDLARHARTIDRTVRSIRRLAPTLPDSASSIPPARETAEPATGPDKARPSV